TIRGRVTEAKALEGFLGALVFRGSIGEVLVKVLFTRQDSDPRRHAACTVIECAQYFFAGRVCFGLGVIRTCCGAHQFKRGGGGDAAVKRAEFALKIARVINLGYFQNGQAVSCPTNLDLLLGGVVRIVVREHLWLGGVFV